MCQELELNLLNDLKKESKKKNRRTSSEIEKNHTVKWFFIYIIYILPISVHMKAVINYMVQMFH